MFVAGYNRTSSRGLFPAPEYATGGGAIDRWGDPTHPNYGLYWNIYDNARAGAPGGVAGAVWIMVMIQTSSTTRSMTANDQARLLHIVDQLRTRDAGVLIWLTPINGYTGTPWPCPTGGGIGVTAAGVQTCADLVDWILDAPERPDLYRGPDLPDLGFGAGTVKGDGCHPSDPTGQDLGGAAMAAFFDGLFPLP